MDARAEEIKIFCGDKLWEICGQKATPLLYLCIVTEGRRIFNSKDQTFVIEQEPLKKLWKIMEDSFIKNT